LFLLIFSSLRFPWFFLIHFLDPMPFLQLPTSFQLFISMLSSLIPKFSFLFSLICSYNPLSFFFNFLWSSPMASLIPP
jgi:hypothetical protein